MLEVTSLIVFRFINSALTLSLLTFFVYYLLVNKRDLGVTLYTVDSYNGSDVSSAAEVILLLP